MKLVLLTLLPSFERDSIRHSMRGPILKAAFIGGFFRSYKNKMKTIVYVDGFNFYFGLLRHSPYKWLDLIKLFEGEILPQYAPDSELVKLKLFTAPILGKFATNGANAQQAQQSYWRALEVSYPDRFEVIKGYYSQGKQNAMQYLSPPDKQQRVDVWKLEEKQTDTKMSLDIYRDSLNPEIDQVIIVSNDSDMEPAAALVKSDSQTRLGVVLPRIQGSQRPLSMKLSSISDWSAAGITEEQLASSQFPERVPTRKKPIRKPSYW